MSLGTGQTLPIAGFRVAILQRFFDALCPPYTFPPLSHLLGEAEVLQRPSAVQLRGMEWNRRGRGSTATLRPSGHPGVAVSCGDAPRKPGAGV